jgi:hypothetical protein
MSKLIKEDGDVHYKSTITRRESLKWLGILSASTLIPSIVGCEDSEQAITISNAVGDSIKGHWPDLILPPITVKGYGKDPSMIIPPKSPLPKTLTVEQLTLVAVLANILVPRAFTILSDTEQLNIIDDIAYQKEDLAEEFTRIAQAFSRFRKLVLAAFFCSPEGTKDLGYLGNVPIAGDYPAPTDEAMVHLNKTYITWG